MTDSAQIETELTIISPKRSSKDARGWEVFFSYYAGFPERFARSILKSASLSPEARVLDPWNGSGTTTYAASQLGLLSTGLDLNPVMLMIARARLLAPSEADAVLPLAHAVTDRLRSDPRGLSAYDPLLDWFAPTTAATLRNIERRIRRELVGKRTLSEQGVNLENIAGIAAAFYVALFSVARQLVAPYQSSNPTWIRRPRGEDRVDVDRTVVIKAFIDSLANMAAVLADPAEREPLYREAQEVFHAETPWVPIAHSVVMMAARKNVLGFRMDPLGRHIFHGVDLQD